MNRRPILVSTCLCIAVIDASQPLMHVWIPKYYGALAGAVLYLAFAIGIYRRVAMARWAVVAMPVIPLTTLALWAAGVPLPIAPDASMIGVLALQLAAAGLAYAER